MKVIQLNAWIGHLLHPLLAFLKEQDADILCLQEVLDSTTDNPLFDTFSLYSAVKELYPYSFFSPTYSFIALGSEVKLGNAIFSKYPIRNEQVIFVNGEYQSEQDINNFKRNIRNLQTCTIELPEREVTIANHHGYHEIDPLGNERSVECMQKVVDHLKTLDQPLIFCGDLNVAPNSKPIQLLESSLPMQNLVVKTDVKSTLSSVFRVPNIEVVADYIFVSPEITISDFRVPGAVISDHMPLILEF